MGCTTPHLSSPDWHSQALRENPTAAPPVTVRRAAAPWCMRPFLTAGAHCGLGCRAARRPAVFGRRRPVLGGRRADPGHTAAHPERVGGDAAVHGTAQPKVHSLSSPHISEGLLGLGRICPPQGRPGAAPPPPPKNCSCAGGPAARAQCVSCHSMGRSAGASATRAAGHAYPSAAVTLWQTKWNPRRKEAQGWAAAPAEEAGGVHSRALVQHGPPA